MLLGFDASRRLAWFAPLDDEGARHGSDLCRRHADAMVVPKGWWLDDRRVSMPQLFTPPPNPPAPPPRSRRHAPPPIEPTPLEPLPLETADTAAETAEWRPIFDQGDDLDGLLDAGTPLLGRAFSGRPRPPARP